MVQRRISGFNPPGPIGQTAAEAGEIKTKTHKINIHFTKENRYNSYVFFPAIMVRRRKSGSTPQGPTRQSATEAEEITLNITNLHKNMFQHICVFQLKWSTISRDSRRSDATRTITGAGAQEQFVVLQSIEFLHSEFSSKNQNFNFTRVKRASAGAPAQF